MMLKEKVAIVTGGARGIGAAIVKRFVEEGALVAIADILVEEGEQLQKELTEKGHEVVFVRTDVSNAQSVEAFVQGVLDRFGKIDILCNNAAVNMPGSVEELEEEVWDKTITVNVKSQFLLSKYVIPHMRKQNQGSIINMASANSFVAEPRLAAYVTSKGAILQLTKAMALDCAPSIRVNCICPGWVDTTFNDAHADLYGGREKVLEGLANVQIIGRPIQPVEIANVAVFLASDLSSCMTGVPVLADGGITAGIA